MLASAQTAQKRPDGVEALKTDSKKKQRIFTLSIRMPKMRV